MAQGRCGVEDDGHSGAMSNAGSGETGCEGDFELQDEDIRTGDGAGHGGTAHVSGAETLVGAGGDEDLLFAAGIDTDLGDDGVAARVFHDVPHVDALGGEAAQEGAAAVIGADTTDEGDTCAQACGGHGLVRAFAAGFRMIEILTGDGLAGFWQPLSANEVVGIGAADDDDAGGGRGTAHGNVLRDALVRLPEIDSHTPSRSLRNQ